MTVLNEKGTAASSQSAFSEMEEKKNADSLLASGRVQRSSPTQKG